jgi:hypothetical protein
MDGCKGGWLGGCNRGSVDVWLGRWLMYGWVVNVRVGSSVIVSVLARQP